MWSRAMFHYVRKCTADRRELAGPRRATLTCFLRQSYREPGTTDVGNARAELVAEQPKNAEDHVCVCAGIGHDFGRLKLCLLFEHDAQQHEAIAQSAGDGDGVEAGKLVGDKIVTDVPGSRGTRIIHNPL